MTSDRRSRARRTGAPEPRPEVDPVAAAAQMEEATQRLRERAWMLNATTQMPVLPAPASADGMAALDSPALDSPGLDEPALG